MFNARITELQKILDSKDERFYRWFHEKTIQELETIEMRLFKELEWAKKGDKRELIIEIKDDIRSLNAVKELQHIHRKLKEMEESESEDDPGGYTIA